MVHLLAQTAQPAQSLPQVVTPKFAPPWYITTFGGIILGAGLTFMIQKALARYNSSLTKSREEEKVNLEKTKKVTEMDTIKPVLEAIQALDLKLTGQIGEVRTDLTGQIGELDKKLTDQINEVRTDLTGQINEARSDLTKQIGEVRTDLTGQTKELKGEFNELRNNLTSQIGQLDKKTTAVEKNLEHFVELLNLDRELNNKPRLNLLSK
ncbi:MAG: hypothetical protein ACRCXZ_09685 [Patescibacteria group bacterium]